MKRFIPFAAMLVFSSSAFSQESGEIVIGASLPLSGFNASAGQEGLTVIKAYFDAVNKTGGVGGRKLVINALDDQFNPQKAAENTRELIDSKAVAIFNCWGTSSCSAMLPLITEAGIPMVAGIAGGGPMRQQSGRFAFNVRATTDLEVAHMLNQMLSVGQRNIAVIYQNDPFGKSGQTAAQGVFAKANLKPVAEIPVERDASNSQAVIDALKAAPGLNGIILLATPSTTVKLVPAVRKAGIASQFYNLAAQATQKVATDLGDFTNGMVFTTLVPSPWKVGFPVVKDYQQMISAATGAKNYSYLGLEVFVNVSVLVEGLRKAGKNVSRGSLVSGLESMGEKRFGPMSVNYSPENHDGTTYVGLTIINRDGRFVE